MTLAEITGSSAGPPLSCALPACLPPCGRAPAWEQQSPERVMNNGRISQDTSTTTGLQRSGNFTLCRTALSALHAARCSLHEAKGVLLEGRAEPESPAARKTQINKVRLAYQALKKAIIALSELEFLCA
jgi:hypothetical protein